MKNLLDSKIFKIIILSIAGLIILVFVFGLGVFVGAKRAEFSFKWAEDYHNNFAGPQGGFFSEMRNAQNEFTDANGSFGKIIKINSNGFSVQDKNNVEKNIIVNAGTSIIFQRKIIKLTDLKTDENVIIIGDPDNSGNISAELVRVLPPQN